MSSSVIILKDQSEEEVKQLVGIDLQENRFLKLKIFKTKKDEQFLKKQFHKFKMVEEKIVEESESLKRYSDYSTFLIKFLSTFITFNNLDMQ